MAIKEIPTNVRVYHRKFVEHYKQKIKELTDTLELLEKEVIVKHKDINCWKEEYIKDFNINLDSYSEFVNNEYSTGNFYKLAKGIVINKENDYELVSNSFFLYDLAETQKLIYDTKKELAFCKKCANVTFKQYTEVLRVYYTEVHKQLILEGNGYSFSNNIGWICVNRCVIERRKPILDYAATKKKEKELLEKGERIYNKDEADWCIRNGLEYNAKDKRVFRIDEYCYQIPLIDSKLTNGSNLKLEISDYRHRQYRGMSNDNLVELCNNNTTKICELSIDLKTKLTLCDKVDKILYTKFIRNESQKPFTFTKIDR